MLNILLPIVDRMALGHYGSAFNTDFYIFPGSKQNVALAME